MKGLEAVPYDLLEYVPEEYEPTTGGLWTGCGKMEVRNI